MPLFEYRCDECGRRFSLLVGVTAERTRLRCPHCGSTKATKLISRIARISRTEEPDEPDFEDEMGEEGLDDDWEED
jgi:putative FmdB family regulatory protein